MRVGSLLSSAALLAQAYAISVEKNSLRANGASAPLDVDTATPRLSWRLSSTKRGDAQTAYQVQASSSDNFDTENLWDSGKTESGHPAATYDGKELSSRSAVYWRVKVWDVDGSESSWSQSSSFEVSLLGEDDWSASWITNKDFATGSTYLPLFSKDFSLDCDVSKARLYLLGLGIHTPEINGESITDRVLEPGYMTVNDTLLYSTHDVTKYLVNGDNVLGVALGKGIYDAEKPLLGRYSKFSEEYQELRLIAQLEYECGSGGSDSGKIVSDDSWLTSVEGPYWETSWYGGEEYDARREIADWSKTEGDRSSWTKATVTTGPSGKLVSPRSPPLRVTEKVKPVAVNKNDDGYWVYDFGVNFVGTFSFSMKQDLEGTRITFWPDEGSGLGQGTTGGPTFDAYTLSSASEQTYSPKYLYHGFQYLGVNTTWEPSLDDMEGLVIRADNEVVLSFETSSDLFEDIHKIIDRSIQGNMYSVLTDCPHREKYGWLEQDHLVFEPLALGYDLERYGYDLVRTMADAQATEPFGLIPDIAPEYGRPMGGGYRNDPNWGNAIIIVPYQLYEYYGDVNFLRMKHEYMIDYINYLKDRAGGKPYLNDGGLGDWEALDTHTNKSVTATFGYYEAARYLAKVEAVLGNDDDAATYAKLAEDIRGGFHELWFHETPSPHYDKNTQAANAIALDMGAVPADYKDDVLSALVESLEANNGLITVGEIGLPSLIRVLRAEKRTDLVYNWISSTSMPSYGYEVMQGATSLWEHWDADESGGSLNHFM